MQEYLTIFIPAFTTLFVIIDPIGLAPIFAGLTDGTSAKHQRKMAIKGTIVATFIMLFFAFAGEPFLGALGIKMYAMRVAGGIMLFYIAIEMVFEKRNERKQVDAEKLEEQFDDISVFPVAIPLISGPGSIATIMLLMSAQQGSLDGQLVVMGAMGAVLVLTLIAFLLAVPIMKLLGETVSTIITRVLGVVLAALAAQFVLDGLKAAFFS